ncbi:twin-arginine translocase TatA/TatE family subunit [Arenibaculum pallidiluteum]|uniref:twin-arginine translocase TatA/TatE family subunit n=1 Tax=Arenibaculum pallidiluteum TaxID=2812559 RepID=UPI001A97581C|nr:twin-arginine translocase TatA/TatE family subunit [Arenibaculum pallidiluteum]
MSIGIWQVILILAVVLIIFGAGKLPNVMGDLAKGMKNFKAGLKDEDEPAAKPKVIEHEAPATASTVAPASPAAGTVAVGGTQPAKDETVKSS